MKPVFILDSDTTEDMICGGLVILGTRDRVLWSMNTLDQVIAIHTTHIL